MSELIKTGGTEWNRDLISTVFNQAEATEILKIPLSSSHEDLSAWAYEKFGTYSVRSAYRLLAEEKAQVEDARRNVAESSNTTSMPMWKQVWKLGVPPKIKSFWWRVLHDFIPTRNKLHQRHIEERADCFLCGAVHETAFHALLKCPRARECWQEIKKATGVKIPNFHPHTWASDILNNNTSKHARALQRERKNQLLNQKCRHDPKSIDPYNPSRALLQINLE